MSIEIDSVRSVRGRIFRVRLRDGLACKTSLWCRLDWHNDDWRLTFYDSFRGADHDWKPLESLNTVQMKLAAEAIVYATRFLSEDDQ